MNRWESPQIWWSRDWGLIWSDDGEHTYRRTEGHRVVEFLHLPRHAVALEYGVCGFTGEACVGA